MPVFVFPALLLLAATGIVVSVIVLRAQLASRRIAVALIVAASLIPLFQSQSSGNFIPAALGLVIVLMGTHLLVRAGKVAAPGNEPAPRTVLDVLWAHFPGQDPAELLDRYPDRFRLMYLKDLREGVVGDLSGHTRSENDVALGDGQLDLPKIPLAACRTRIEHYYIEDESPSFALQVPRSLAYLASLRLESTPAPDTAGA